MQNCLSLKYNGYYVRCTTYCNIQKLHSLTDWIYVYRIILTINDYFLMQHHSVSLSNGDVMFS
jgi:hypothetical protein